MSLYPPRLQMLGFLAWFLVVFLAAAAGALASADAATYYLQLNRPYWAPPASVFGPVWSVLYAAMALAAWMVWREKGSRDRSRGLVLFPLQLALNALWSWLFFAWKWPAAALLDVVLLGFLVAATMAHFWRARALAGFLFVPYLFWAGFAAAFNLAIWRMNPGPLP